MLRGANKPSRQGTKAVLIASDGEYGVLFSAFTISASLHMHGLFAFINIAFDILP